MRIYPGGGDSDNGDRDESQQRGMRGEREAGRILPHESTACDPPTHLHVEVHQLLEVGAHDLVAVDEDDAVHAQREEHVEEEDLVGPVERELVGVMVG